MEDIPEHILETVKKLIQKRTKKCSYRANRIFRIDPVIRILHFDSLSYQFKNKAGLVEYIGMSEENIQSDEMLMTEIVDIFMRKIAAGQRMGLTCRVSYETIYKCIFGGVRIRAIYTLLYAIHEIKEVRILIQKNCPKCDYLLKLLDILFEKTTLENIIYSLNEQNEQSAVELRDNLHEFAYNYITCSKIKMHKFRRVYEKLTTE